MSHKHKVKIEKLFEHPVSGNIDNKKLLRALEHYDVNVDMTKQNKAKLSYNNNDFVLTLAHRNNLSVDSVVDLRHFLEKVGLTPDKLK